MSSFCRQVGVIPFHPNVIPWSLLDQPTDSSLSLSLLELKPRVGPSQKEIGFGLQFKRVPPSLWGEGRGGASVNLLDQSFKLAKISTACLMQVMLGRYRF